MATLDINGHQLSLSAAQVELLRDSAAARAGYSAQLRDLSLVLDRASRSGRVVALRRAEARALAELLAVQTGADLAQLQQAVAESVELE